MTFLVTIIFSYFGYQHQYGKLPKIKLTKDQALEVKKLKVVDRSFLRQEGEWSTFIRFL